MESNTLTYNISAVILCFFPPQKGLVWKTILALQPDLEQEILHSPPSSTQGTVRIDLQKNREMDKMSPSSRNLKYIRFIKVIESNDAYLPQPLGKLRIQCSSYSRQDTQPTADRRGQLCTATEQMFIKHNLIMSLTTLTNIMDTN